MTEPRPLSAVADPFIPGFPIFWRRIAHCPPRLPRVATLEILATVPPLPPTTQHVRNVGPVLGDVPLAGPCTPKMQPGAMPKKHIFRCFTRCSKIRPGERQGVILLAAICRDLPRSAAKQVQKPG